MGGKGSGSKGKNAGIKGELKLGAGIKRKARSVRRDRVVNMYLNWQ